MKRLLPALLLCGATLLTTTMSASAYDLDFPNQLRAIKVCYTQWSTEHPSKAITDAQLVACMNAQGFRFDPNRQIKGVGPCHGNKTSTNHPDCYAEPPKTRAQAEPTQRPELRAFQVIYFVWEEHGPMKRAPFALLSSGVRQIIVAYR